MKFNFKFGDRVIVNGRFAKFQRYGEGTQVLVNFEEGGLGFVSFDSVIPFGMKKIKWVIEKDLFDEYDTKLIEEIKSLPYCEVIHLDVEKMKESEDYNLYGLIHKNLNEDDIVIFHGSLQLGKHIANRTPLYPGVYLNLIAYECYNYYGYYGGDLLNSDYIMMGINDVLRNKHFIISRFGFSGKIFIRPSNGYKTFTGQTISVENFEQDLDILRKCYGGVPDDTLVVLSSAKEIDEEYRFVIADGDIVSGALYYDKVNRDSFKAYYDKPCKDIEAIKFANLMSVKYSPDKIYNMDVARLSDGTYKVIEINSFCCGSLYGNDIKSVVSRVNEVVYHDYWDIYGE